MNLLEIGDYIFPTLLACTEKEQAKGLMWIRKDPPVMSFLYKKPGIHKMWMRNTYVPLDIIFCKNNKIISIMKGTPLSDEEVGPDEFVDMVVEMPAGTCDELDINVGQLISLKVNDLSFS